MRKHVILVAGMMLFCSKAMAQVEPRLAGDWKIDEAGGQPAKVLHIGGDGRYQLTNSGQVVDSGRITAGEGAVKLQSDSGKQEQGRFSVIGGELKMHGGSVEGSWSRSGSSAPSNFVQKSAAPLVTPSVGNSGHPSAASIYSSPSSSSSSSSSGVSSSQAVPPSKQIWGSVSETHTSTQGPPSSTNWAPPASTSDSSTSTMMGTSVSAPSSTFSSTAPSGSSNTLNAASSTAPASLPAASSHQSGERKSTGNKIINFVKNNLNAVNDAASNFNFGSTTTTQTTGINSGSSYSSGNYSGSNNSRANAFITPTAAQRYYGSGGMPKRSTSAGIPVMKDGTARKIRFGR